MDSTVRDFLRDTGPVLCLDIGSGTQDALLARPGLECENWPRFVLPAPARLAAQRIRELTLLRRGIWLYGDNMGGGFTQAVREHLAAGLRVCATAAATRGIHDNEDVVRGLGVEIRSACPEGCVPVHLADYAPDFWVALLRQAGLPLPHMVLAAAQDHGFHPGGNRQARMRAWSELLSSSAEPARWIYAEPPFALTRLIPLHAKTGGPVADTGTSALLGALCDREVMERSFRQGVTIVNVGNGHTVAALVYRGQVRGIYEHHTGMRTREQLLGDLEQFRRSWLPAEEVQATGGHGTAFGPYCEEAGGYAPTYITGPRRTLLEGQGRFLAPHGDMMLAGCFGLLWGWAHARAAAAQADGETPHIPL
ncbi:DUF1786 domain-containing protein [uncultured Desulfovibrio sp.]|uniref:DUF1786 domain-containing protein n=1 Tax=uncultured Desulfovibrio sp. TaxID=167968 RepID=UPI002628B3BF|nr:DUF1786 domain-containing protein [uncultured Desulfovibrio sp.]